MQWSVTSETEGVEKVANGLSLSTLRNDHEGCWHSHCCGCGCSKSLMVKPTSQLSGTLEEQNKSHYILVISQSLVVSGTINSIIL